VTKIICPHCNKVIVETLREEYSSEYIQCPHCAGIYELKDCKKE
jgi:phage FluMu protein Com